MFSATHTLMMNWLSLLWWASIQICMVVLVALVVARLLRRRFRSPAWIEPWLWRLVYVKLLLLLVVTQPIPIRILRPMESSPVQEGSLAQIPTDPSIIDPSIIDPSIIDPSITDAGASQVPVVATHNAIGERTNQRTSELSSQPMASSMSVQAESKNVFLWPTWDTAISALFSVWFIGAAINLWVLVRRCIASRQLRWEPLSTPWIVAERDRLCTAFSIQSGPRLAVSGQVPGPLLVGILHPTIVFSEDSLRCCANNHIRSILAHELAHCKRRDLAWNLMPALAQVLFYFHPLMWFAHHRFQLSGELAADEAAVGISKGSIAQYGDSLVQVALLSRARRRHVPSLYQVAAVRSSRSLKKRLDAMKTFSKCSRRRACFIAVIVTGMASLSLLPFQLDHRASAAPPSEDAASVGENMDFEQKLESGAAQDWGGGGQGYALTLDDENPHSGTSCGWIAGGADTGFGTFTQCISVDELVGKRVEFRGYLRSELRGGGSGGLWMRVDAGETSVSFDNMHDRRVTGKTDWRQHKIVLDVPAGSTRICFGFLMTGKGNLWADDFRIEALGAAGEGPETTGTVADEINAWSGLDNLDFESVSKANPKLPEGWGGGGYGYELRRDTEVKHSGTASGRIAKSGEKDGFGTFTKMFPAKEYLGKRVRLSGYLKTRDAKASGLWMRVDGPDNKPTAFDNMQTRSVTGTTDWKEYEVILDVDKNTKNIAIGFLLIGDGTVWGDDLKLEVAGELGEGPGATDIL